MYVRVFNSIENHWKKQISHKNSSVFFDILWFHAMSKNFEPIYKIEEVDTEKTWTKTDIPLESFMFGDAWDKLGKSNWSIHESC